MVTAGRSRFLILCCQRISDRRATSTFWSSSPPERVPGSLGLAGVEIGLSALFGGRKLDRRAAEELSGYSR